MKKALSHSTDFMNSIDLDNATYEKEVLKLLEKFSAESENKVTEVSSGTPSTSIA